MTSRTMATTNLYNIETASVSNIRTMKSITDVGNDKKIHHPLHHVNETEVVWDMIENTFGIDRYNIWSTSVYLLEHRESIMLGQHPVCFVNIVSNITTTTSSGGGCPPKLNGILHEWIQYYHQFDVALPSLGKYRSKLSAIMAARQKAAKERPKGKTVVLNSRNKK